MSYRSRKYHSFLDLPTLQVMQHFYPPQETKVKPAPKTKVEEYPEIEKFIPYDPLGRHNRSPPFTDQKFWLPCYDYDHH